MSSQTPNLHLIKPSGDENYDISIFNGNSDILDSVIYTIISGLEPMSTGLSESMAEVYDARLTFNAGDYAVHDYKLYKCNTDNTTGTWNSSKWDRVSITDELTNILEIAIAILGNIGPNYNFSTTYNVDDYAIYDNVLYRCNDDNVTGAWDSDKWDAVTIVGTKQDNLTYDMVPTSDSMNSVTSGGIYNYVTSIVGNIETILQSINGTS